MDSFVQAFPSYFVFKLNSKKSSKNCFPKCTNIFSLIKFKLIFTQFVGSCCVISVGQPAVLISPCESDLLFFLDCLPFPLTLRIWDIFILEGEQVLLTTAFCILRIHRKKILHLKNLESINSFLKTELCVNFAGSSLTFDEIIEEYIVCAEKLKQNNLLSLPASTENELPTKPFNISMGDITKLATSPVKKSLTPDEISENNNNNASSLFYFEESVVLSASIILVSSKDI